MKRATIVVEGSLAFAMNRAAAAKSASIGLEVVTLPRLAARLAGGFVQPADAGVLMPAIVSALGEGGFAELERVIDRPGLPRAVLGSLLSVWRSDTDLAALAGSPRVSDMRLVENRVKSILPACHLTDRDLRDAAVANASMAPALFGEITIKDVIHIDPVWRPLVIELSRHCRVSWVGGGPMDREWFEGPTTPSQEKHDRVEAFYSCADPGAEVIEALRWVRARLSGGAVKASELAICATDTSHYDEAMLVYRRSSDLPIFFSNGVPALSTNAGQVCAALADLLTRGVDKSRVLRFLSGLGSVAPLEDLPGGWQRALPREATLDTYGAWRDVLAQPDLSGEHGPRIASVILPLIASFERGPDSAEELGKKLLRGDAAAIWHRALQLGPPHAIAFTLEKLRLSDDGDPAGSVVWGTADQVANAPRDRVRLLGLSSNVWPRRASDDAILPHHIVDRQIIAPVPVAGYDRACFATLRENSSEFVASLARRGSRGTLQTPGPLWPVGQDTVLHRLRVPDHAFSENDRLMARPSEAKTYIPVERTRAAWSNWHQPVITLHDGIITKDHPVITRALAEPLSSAAMRRLLRDQLAFAWSEGLGWRERKKPGLQLSMSPTEFGTLVHEILARALATLDAGPGVASANEEERLRAFAAAVTAVDRRWTLERTIPPRRLWRATLELAQTLGITALTVDEDLIGKVSTWTEVGFGGVGHGLDRLPPWKSADEVVLAGTELRLSGRIDRLDIAKTKNGFMVTDYKTGSKGPARTSLIEGGRNIQPLLYVAAAGTHLPDANRKVARVIFLREADPDTRVSGDELDQAMADFSAFALNAEAAVRSGMTLPGPDAWESSPFRLALPADIQLYMRKKSGGLASMQRSVAEGWRL